MALRMRDLVEFCRTLQTGWQTKLLSLAAFSLVLLGLILIVTQTKEAERSINEWNKLIETIIEAANTEAFTLALRAQAKHH